MEDTNWEKMTATELREFALKNYPDITGVHAMKKEDLLAAIHQARGEDVKGRKAEKKGAKLPIDKTGLKKQIRLLKKQREELFKEKNKKAISQLRKKIKRLKRLTKKAA